MAGDNTPFVASLDLAAPKIADDEVPYSGDLAKVQIIQLAFVTGAEGSHVLAKIGPGPQLAATSLPVTLPTDSLTPGGAFRVGSSETVLAASVASGQTLQAAGSDLGGLRNWGILIPSTFDGTQIQFQMSDTLGGTYVGVYDITNTRVIMTVAASRYYDIPGELLGIRFLKIECLTAQATSATDFLIIGKS
jgi:hypothetical protein